MTEPTFGKITESRFLVATHVFLILCEARTVFYDKLDSNKVLKESNLFRKHKEVSKHLRKSMNGKKSSISNICIYSKEFHGYDQSEE